MTDFLRNPVKDRMRAGETTYGTLVTMPSPGVAQILSNCGFDWLWFDLEHGPIPFDGLHNMINATATGSGETIPVTRVPADEWWSVKPVLDTGSLGVVFPFIETAEQAQVAVDSTRYPPAGKRGFGPFYAASRWNRDLRAYAQQADEAILRVLMLESKTAVNNAREIMAVDGIDVAFLAPFDLSQSLGVPGQFDAPEYLDALATLEAAVDESSALKGTLVLDADMANGKRDQGYKFLALGLDIALLESSAKGLLASAKG